MNKRSALVEKIQWIVLPALALSCVTVGAWAYDHEKIDPSAVYAPVITRPEGVDGPSWLVYRQPEYLGDKLVTTGLGQIITDLYVDEENATVEFLVRGQENEIESYKVKFSKLGRALIDASRLRNSMRIQSGLSLDISGCVKAIPVYSSEFTTTDDLNRKVKCERVHSRLSVECTDAAWTRTPTVLVRQKGMIQDSAKSANPIYSHEDKCPNLNHTRSMGRQ